jgi:AraC-like DNA-binding protein
MLEKIIYLLDALLGFITIILIGFRYKTNRNTNLYFILFLFLSSFRFLAHGLDEIKLFRYYQKQIDLSFIITSWSLLYLYFRNLVNNSSHIKTKDLLHLILPLILFIFYCNEAHFNNKTFVVGRKIGFIIIVLLSVGYLIYIYKLLKNNVWKRKSDVLVINNQNKIIKQWTQFLFILFALMLIRFLINLLLNPSIIWYINQNNFLWMGGLIWIVMYAKILYSPDFLYGYDLFQNKLKEYKKNNIIFDNIWTFNTAKQIVNIQDNLLKEKITPNIENYILNIEHLALNTNLFFTKNFDTTHLAQKMIIPKSHVLYVFKYHTIISFNDFKKIIRIQKTIQLMEDGFLNNNTMEALAVQTGFTSYSAFFKSFKSISGMSPQEYNKS